MRVPKKERQRLLQETIERNPFIKDEELSKHFSGLRPDIEKGDTR
jgi:glycerol-3-phosphate dehydrogenase